MDVKFQRHGFVKGTDEFELYLTIIKYDESFNRKIVELYMIEALYIRRSPFVK
ncbi:hypothetical protein CHS0354_034998, partial [Potamilus streckersoni]